MKLRITRSIPVLTLLLVSAATLCAQDASQNASQPASQTSPQPNPYAGVSHPPADDVIETSSIPEAKPPAGKPLVESAAPAPTQPVAPVTAAAPMPDNAAPAVAAASATMPAPSAVDGTDDGIVGIGDPVAGQPLNQRAMVADPDGDIVHPRAMRLGELQEGTVIRVRLLDRLSTAETERGEPFHTRVASDVLQGGQVIIPAGAEIDGKVVEVSAGHPGGHGTMRLDPESVVLPNGTRFRLHAEVTSTPGSNTKVVGEGTIRPDSRLKRDGIEYGGAVGAGAVTGAIVAGPVGALTGSLIGAGAITVHLLVSHPQATLDSGTTLMFMLTDPLYMAPETMNGN